MLSGSMSLSFLRSWFGLLAPHREVFTAGNSLPAILQQADVVERLTLLVFRDTDDLSLSTTLLEGLDAQ